MSLPGSRLSSGISSSTGRLADARVAPLDRRSSVLENTTFGSAFMSSPVGLCELGHACAMSCAARRAEHEQAGLAEQLGHRALAVGAVRLRPPSQSIVPSRRAAKPSSDIDM